MLILFLLCSKIFFNSFTSFFSFPIFLSFHFSSYPSFLSSWLPFLHSFLLPSLLAFFPHQPLFLSSSLAPFIPSSNASLLFFLTSQTSKKIASFSRKSLSSSFYFLSLPSFPHFLLSFLWLDLAFLLLLTILCFLSLSSSLYVCLPLVFSRSPSHYNFWYVRYAPGATLCRCRDPHLQFTRVYNTKPTCLECVTSRSVGASRRYGADIIGNRIQTLSFTQRTKKSGGRPTRRSGQTVHVDTCVRIEN